MQLLFPEGLLELLPSEHRGCQLFCEAYVHFLECKIAVKVAAACVFYISALTYQPSEGAYMRFT